MATYRKMKINHAVSELDNPQVIKNNRRTIARLKTEIKRREMAASKEA
jgi:large subunit ribosomal protein L29